MYAVADASQAAKTDAAASARTASANGVPRKGSKAPSLRQQAHVRSHQQQQEQQKQQQLEQELPWYDDDTAVWTWKDDRGNMQVRAVLRLLLAGQVWLATCLTLRTSKPEPAFLIPSLLHNKSSFLPCLCLGSASHGRPVFSHLLPPTASCPCSDPNPTLTLSLTLNPDPKSYATATLSLARTLAHLPTHRSVFLFCRRGRSRWHTCAHGITRATSRLTCP